MAVSGVSSGRGAKSYHAITHLSDDVVILISRVTGGDRYVVGVWDAVVEGRCLQLTLQLMQQQNRIVLIVAESTPQ